MCERASLWYSGVLVTPGSFPARAKKPRSQALRRSLLAQNLSPPNTPSRSRISRLTAGAVMPLSRRDLDIRALIVKGTCPDVCSAWPLAEYRSPIRDVVRR